MFNNIIYAFIFALILAVLGIGLIYAKKILGTIHDNLEERLERKLEGKFDQFSEHNVEKKIHEALAERL